MRLWDVLIQNAAGRTTTWTGRATTGTQAAKLACKHEAEQTGDDSWLPIRATQR